MTVALFFREHDLNFGVHSIMLWERNVTMFSVNSGTSVQKEDATLIGWSGKINDPEILEATRKKEKQALGYSWIFALLFPIGFLLAGLFLDGMPLKEAIFIGVSLGVIMLGVNFWQIKKMKRPIWEGIVTEKLQKERSRHDSDDDSVTYYTEYIVKIKTDNGKNKRIVEKDRRKPMYDYLAINDRVRFHPAFGTYEKFDKSRDEIIYCNICRMKNPIANDRCTRCKNFLFK